ncbi:sulfurtransferase [Leptospira langatensis]|uniref:Sulfurtransferase n=1 Tax=Leptospira langatensis TaxID=2484983 RepID=A0A5F1ZRQ1_9LEPT|nr:sulfurtransferase [Leptospira langatensis]TGJ98960.1 sulfurtransferase [Leptospira langatensis]TGL40471.1 sulfurtransferase [Leptospira langatensis]
MKNTLIQASLLVVLLGLFGNCGGGGGGSSAGLAALGLGGEGVKVSSASDLVVESSDNYDDNKFGLISATTLRTWVSNWSANKPAGITGNLVIYQANRVGSDSNKSLILPTTGVKVFVAVDGNSPSTYSWKTFRETRSNGAISIPGGDASTGGFGIISGANIDAWFQTYGIDPTKDLIVFASGNGDNYGAIGHQHYISKYWGVDNTHLAVLNGSIKGQFPEAELGNDSDASVPPLDGTFSVKQLKNVDNRVLALSVQDIIDIAKNNGHHSVAGVSQNVYIADVRTKNNSDDISTYTSSAGYQEFWGAENATGTTKTGGGAIAFEGHLKGAVFVPHYNFVDRSTLDNTYSYGASAAGTFATLKFKSKASVKDIWDNYGTSGGPNAGASAWQEGQTVLQYCRTNTRSQTSGLTTALILGRPTAFVEDGWSIFGLLAGGFPSATNFNADVTSGDVYPSVPTEFAPDVQGAVESGARNSGGAPHYNSGVKESTVNYFNINSGAVTTKKVLEDDWSYKNQ